MLFHLFLLFWIWNKRFDKKQVYLFKNFTRPTLVWTINLLYSGCLSHQTKKISFKQSYLVLGSARVIFYLHLVKFFYEHIFLLKNLFPLAPTHEMVVAHEMHGTFQEGSFKLVATK